LEMKGIRIASISLERNQLYFFKEEENEKTYLRIIEILGSLCRLLDEKTVFALENTLLKDLLEYIQSLLNALILSQENSIPKFKEALDFCETFLAKNAGSLVDNARESERLYEEYCLLKDELARIRSLDTREQNNIVVMLESESDIVCELAISYALPGASWSTSYDTKADTGTKKVELSYFGEITQATGENWDNAKIVLSTTISETDANIPNIYPVYLSGYVEKRSKELGIEMKDIKNIPDAVNPDNIVGEESGGPQDEEKDTSREEGRIVIEKKGVSYTFSIQEPLSIPPDGRAHKGLIAKAELPVELFYETVPRIREYVYLRANSRNTLDLPLLPGKVFVYRNGSYMGRSTLKYTAPDESFVLSFGIDDDLRVKRIEHMNVFIPAKGLSNRNTKEWEYQFILYNHKDKDQRVRLREGIYVSSLKEVELKIANDTSAEYSLDKDGVVCWDIDLPKNAREHIKRKLHYSLSAPKDFDISGF